MLSKHQKNVVIRIYEIMMSSKQNTVSQHDNLTRNVTFDLCA